MTIKDEILMELRKRMPLAEIKRKYRSQSQLYEAIREFLQEADKIAEEALERLGRVEKGLSEAETELKRLNCEREKVSGELHELVQTREKLIGDVRRRTEELQRLNADITELQAKGFTSEIVKKIMAIDSRSGSELLSQMETVEEYRKMEEEFSGLKKNKATLEGRIRTLESKKGKIEERVISERNRLDELKLRTTTFREAVGVVCSLFRDGYSTSDIKSLKDGLNALGIKGDPLLTITRLVTGLKKYKTLVALENKVSETTKELGMLRKATVEAKSDLKVAKQLIKTFKEVKNAGVNAIAGTAEQAERTITGTATMAEKQVTASLEKFDAHILLTMGGVRGELGEYGELQQQTGRLKEIVELAFVFLGILQEPDYLKKVPLGLIVQIFERLHLWSRMILPNAKIRPSQNIQNKNFNLQTWHSYEISVLIEFICEGLREIVLRQSRETESTRASNW